MTELLSTKHATKKTGENKFLYVVFKRPIYTIQFVAFDSYSGICDRVNTRKTNFKFRHQLTSKNLTSALVSIRQSKNCMRQIVLCRQTLVSGMFICISYIYLFKIIMFGFWKLIYGRVT